ncbi:MAG: CoA pyrophosphatase [Litorilinea sp.]
MENSPDRGEKTGPPPAQPPPVDPAEFLAALRADLNAPLPGRAAHARMAPRPQVGPPRAEDPRADARQGAVLALFYLHKGRLWLPFILRATYNGVHSGQISFPGGGLEPHDDNLIETALRETHEEIGVPPASIQVLGELSPIYIAPSNFLVQPVIGFTSDRPTFHLDPYEVAELMEVELADLLNPRNQRQEVRPLRDERLADVPYFAIHERAIWGATAMILAELTALPALRPLRNAAQQAQ